MTHDDSTTLVLGGTDKTGRRVVERLGARGTPVRAASRSGQPPFDWNGETTWAPVLHGVRAVYIPYPDLVSPAATATTRAFAVRCFARLVLLTGRGAGDPWLLSLPEAVAEIAKARHWDIAYETVPPLRYTAAAGAWTPEVDR